MTSPMRLAPAQRPHATETLTQAFRHDPMYLYICPDEAARMAVTRRLWDAMIRLILIYGEVWTTAEVSGVACWLAPGHTTIGLRHMLRTGFALPRALMGFRPNALRRAIGVFGYTERLHQRAMPGPHWYLMALGVAPASQGQGIGSSLIQPVLAQADAAGLPCYLETETARNVAFYQKHGFEALTAEKPPYHDLMLWAMARPPAPGARGTAGKA